MTNRTSVVLIADDLTGANASGGLLRAAGFATASLLAQERLASYLGEYDAISVDAGTRDCSAQMAYDRLRALSSLATSAGVRLVGKRIDSTLRGNVGSEIDGALDGRGSGAVALVVAAVPALRRVTTGGCLLVDGLPLPESLRGADPWSAPVTSVVADIIAAQSRYRPASLGLADVEAGIEAVRARLRDLSARGFRIIVADAMTDAHISTLAGAALGLPLVPVDPGPFSAELAREAVTQSCQTSPVLAVVGSVTSRTRDQIALLLSVPGARLTQVDGLELCSSGFEAEVRRALTTLEQGEHASVLVVASGQSAESVLDLHVLERETGLSAKDAARRISAGLAEITARFLASGRAVRGLYTTGGAVTQAIAHRLGAEAIDLEREVLPLAVLGRLRGGPYAGLRLVSKGGLVGDDRAAAACVQALTATPMHTIGAAAS